MNHFLRPTYFYYNAKRHTFNVCYIRTYGIPYGEHVRVRKGYNPKGPKEYWILKYH